MLILARYGTILKANTGSWVVKILFQIVVVAIRPLLLLVTKCTQDNIDCDAWSFLLWPI